MRLSELRILYEVLNDDRERIGYAIQSIGQGLVTIDDFENGNWFEDVYHLFYSSDDYVTDFYGNVLDRDYAFYCQGEDNWFSDEEAVTVYEYRGENAYSRRWAEGNCDLNTYRGDYYDSDAMGHHNLVYVEDEGEIWIEDDAYYHDGDGCYRSYPPDEKETYLREYHNGSYKCKSFDGKSKYKIGYEIEKEDEDVLESINIENFEYETDNVWRKEKDGSLNNGSGYELISPTFEFDIKKIFEYIEGNDVLVRHINAAISPRCGGHIHLSEKYLSGQELFDKIKGYTPLFYALYYGRVDKNYSKGKSNRDLAYDNIKNQAIKIYHDRVEFRIISAVPNMTTLKWRSKLLMMILQHPTDDIIRAYYNVDTKFTKLLKQTYSDEKLLALKQRFIDFTKQFEGLDINDKKE